jgi:hypothetical protein
MRFAVLAAKAQVSFGQIDMMPGPQERLGRRDTRRHHPGLCAFRAGGTADGCGGQCQATMTVVHHQQQNKADGTGGTPDG